MAVARRCMHFAGKTCDTGWNGETLASGASSTITLRLAVCAARTRYHAGVIRRGAVMANARTRYDTISEFLQREHEAAAVSLYGKPAVQLGATPFLFYATNGMAFRLQGRVREHALTLPGSSGWVPIGQLSEKTPWVLVPASHFLRWDRLAIEALRYAQEGDLRRPQAVPSRGPPPEPPASQRWRDNIKALMEKAAAFRLLR